MPDVEVNGLLRDGDGAVVVVLKADATAPLTFDSGFLVDAENRLVIVEAT